MSWSRTVGISLVAATAVFSTANIASAAAAACNTRVNNNVSKLMECVTVDSVLAHMATLQAIADANGGNRASGTPGHDASAAYAASVFGAAGYNVTLQPFSFPFFEEHTPAILEQLAPIFTVYPYFEPEGFATMSYSGSGNVTGVAQAVDVVIPAGAAPNTSTSGCQVADFAGFVPGRIAILQRGSCSFAVKAINAEAAGAAAVVIFNEGQPGRINAFVGTLGGPVVDIPVLGANYNVGVEFATVPNLSLHIVTDTTSETRSTVNVLAESRSGRPDNVVMVGAHLDSVADGPGINDNGSGSAAILDVAVQMARVNLRNKVRFALWGAEESGLLGSTHYVDTLTAAEVGTIALYLNFDMIGSPNYFLGIYDGDNSDGVGAGPGPDGSAQIEKQFEAFYTSRGEAFAGTDFSGRSDYGPFIEIGIPAGGLFTGAEEIKTAADVTRWGGTAGVAYDPCYHQACDTYANLSHHALDLNSDAVAAVTLTFGMNTQEINGVRGKGNFKPGKMLYKGNDLQM